MSPIRGVSEITRLTRLGKIHLGVKVESSKGQLIPKAVDYFVCPPEVQAVHGEKPKSLPIMFPLEDVEQFAQQWYRAYSQTRGLICKGDGEKATQLTDLKTGAIAEKDAGRTVMKDVSCPGEDCQLYQTKRCRRVMNLQFLLPEVPGIGVWQLDTSSFFGIVNINSSIQLIRGICGRIRMMPLVLSVGPREVAPEGKKKVVQVLSLTAPHSLNELISQAQPTGQVAIPAPDTERPDLLFPDENLPSEDRVPDVDQAKEDMETLWEQLGGAEVRKPEHAFPADQRLRMPRKGEDAPEPHEDASAGNSGEKTEVTRQKIRNAMRKRWPEDTAGKNTAPFCQQWGANTVDEIPEAHLHEALARITPKGGQECD